MLHDKTKIENLTRQLEQMKQMQATSITLLKACSTQVGMIMGESILEHIAQVTGGYFSSKEYTSERMPGEQ